MKQLALSKQDTVTLIKKKQVQIKKYFKHFMPPYGSFDQNNWPLILNPKTNFYNKVKPKYPINKPIQILEPFAYTKLLKHQNNQHIPTESTITYAADNKISKTIFPIKTYQKAKTHSLSPAHMTNQMTRITAQITSITAHKENNQHFYLLTIQLIEIKDA